MTEQTTEPTKTYKKRNQREVGLFLAKVINSYTVPSENGAQAAVEYEYQQTEVVDKTEKTVLKRITGLFALSGDAQDYTFEKLQNSGYLFGDDNLVDLHEGQGFDLNHRCQINIIEEEGHDKDKDGKTIVPKWYKKVAFVNLLGGATAQKKMAKEEHIVKMQGLNIAGGLAAFRAKNNIVKPVKSHAENLQAQIEQPTFTADDIPF